MRSVAVLVLLVLAGCAMGPRMQSLYPQMTEAAVVSLLGRPDGARAYGDYTVYTYANRLMSDWSWDRADYHVVMDTQRRVVAYGPGEIRTAQNGVVVLVPVPR